MSEPGQNLARLLDAISRAGRTGGSAPLADLLARDVAWDGRYKGQRCSGRKEVLERLDQGFGLGWRITRLDIREAGADVIVTAEGPNFIDYRPDGTEAPGPVATMTFTFAGGKVVHLQG